MISVRYIVLGKVQGVWYRKNAQEIALKNQITGFIQNQSDGSVLVVAHGSKENISIFESWCRVGPPESYVTKVMVEKIDFVELNDFEIRN